MEQLDYHLLYRWFIGLAPDDLVWNATIFTTTRDRLQAGDVFPKIHDQATEPSAGEAALATTLSRWMGR